MEENVKEEPPTGMETDDAPGVASTTTTNESPNVNSLPSDDGAAIEPQNDNSASATDEASDIKTSIVTEGQSAINTKTEIKTEPEVQLPF